MLVPAEFVMDCAKPFDPCAKMGAPLIAFPAESRTVTGDVARGRCDGNDFCCRGGRDGNRIFHRLPESRTRNLDRNGAERNLELILVTRIRSADRVLRALNIPPPLRFTPTQAFSTGVPSPALRILTLSVLSAATNACAQAIRPAPSRPSLMRCTWMESLGGQ